MRNVVSHFEAFVLGSRLLLLSVACTTPSVCFCGELDLRAAVNWATLSGEECTYLRYFFLRRIRGLETTRVFLDVLKGGRLPRYFAAFPRLDFSGEGGLLASYVSAVVHAVSFF